VEGLQGGGAPVQPGEGRVIATAKHYLGDGGTADGRDQGDTLASEENLRDIHAPGYVAAIEAGVHTVMASYSSWRGVKMHGNEGLLTDVLKDRMGFDGFVVGDWNGHGQLPGCTNDNCPAAFNAGIDMFMVPQDWKALYQNTLDQVRSGVISEERLNDAARRILRVKARGAPLPRAAQER
jgi:beta-glucosidase